MHEQYRQIAFLQPVFGAVPRRQIASDKFDAVVREACCVRSLRKQRGNLTRLATTQVLLHILDQQSIWVGLACHAPERDDGVIVAIAGLSDRHQQAPMRQRPGRCEDRRQALRIVAKIGEHLRAAAQPIEIAATTVVVAVATEFAQCAADRVQWQFQMDGGGHRRQCVGDVVPRRATARHAQVVRG